MTHIIHLINNSMKKQLKNLCLLTLAHNQSNINYDLIIIGQKVKMFKSEKEITLTQQGQKGQCSFGLDCIFSQTRT